MLENLDLISKIVSVFGKESYIDKQLNRPYLAKKIFNDLHAKEKLNALVHPTVYQSFSLWKSKQVSKFVFNESALLFETGSANRFDLTWLVTADLETRISRIKKRDLISIEEIENKIKNQMSEEEKKKLTPFQIINDDKHLIVPQILKLLEMSK
jgi:dephospho-CoA kinase